MDTLLKVIEEWGWWYEGNQDTSKTLLNPSVCRLYSLQWELY